MERERLHPLRTVAKRRVARQAGNVEIARRQVVLAGLDVPVRVAVARGLHRARIAFLRIAQRELGALALGDVAADAAIAEEAAPGVEAGLAADLVEPLRAVLHAGEAEIHDPLMRVAHRAMRRPARLV